MFTPKRQSNTGLSSARSQSLNKRWNPKTNKKNTVPAVDILVNNAAILLNFIQLDAETPVYLVLLPPNV
jgi:hypothetical protein